MNKILTMIIGSFIVVVLLGSVLMPVINNTDDLDTTSRVTLTNEGTPLIMGDVEDDYTMNWDSALPGTIKVNSPNVTVYFIAGSDATVSPESKTVIEGLTYGELPTPTRSGYTFDGWYTSQQYITQITADSVVLGSSDIILYAKWTGNQYTVTFDADGGSVSPGTMTVTFGSAYGELPTPTYTGHIFGGWFDENDNPITAATVVSIADNHTLYAAWTLEQYLVSFTTDGHGTVDVQSMLVDYGTAYTILDNTITIGFTTITATASSGWVWYQWVPSTSGTITEATTFTATFNQPPVTLTFTAQSPGSVDTASIANVDRMTQYVVADNVVTVVGYGSVTAALVDGYYFTGWNVPQGSGTVTDAMTFTAEYELIEIAKVSSNGGTATWVVTTDGKLFGCGANNSGQQGDGTTTNVTTFTQRLTTETIASVVDGAGSTTWVVTTDGKLFGCGSNNKGQQGDGTTNNVTTFTQRLTTETIASVTASASTTWVVTTDGKLFGCGSNNYSQQGDGTTTDVTTFTQRLTTETIASVTASANTTWVVTTDGKLFGCGRSNHGQLGNGSTANVTTFTQSLTTETIASVSANTETTWVVTTDGKLFGSGYNNKGQQGNGSTTDVTTFTQRLTTETIASVSALSANTTWVVTTDGKLFGCGSGSSGQQGNGSTTDVTTFIQRLTTETIASVGTSSGYSVTWALTTDGKLFGCGANSSGQQGDGTTNNVTTFTQRLTTETIASFTGGYLTFAITTDGKLFGCGANGYGQQGNGSTTNVTTFTQCGPSGINVVASQISNPQQITPIILNPLHPITPGILNPINLQNINISDPSGYTFHAGGNDWMLCTVSVGQDEYALALYYAGLTDPLLWTDDVTLEFSNGSLTVENGGVTYVMTYTSIYFVGDHGTYVLMDGSAYIYDDTTVIGFAIPTADSGIEVTGTAAGVNAISIADGSITIGDAAISVDDSDYDGVLILSELSASYDTDDVAICSSVIVPASVTVTTTTEGSSISSLLAAIPLIVIAALLILIVGGFVMAKRE